MFYVAVETIENSTLDLPQEHEERALFIVEGDVTIDEQRFSAGQMLVFTPASNPVIYITSGSKLMTLGGAPIGRRKIWWNLVATDLEKIERAKEHWRISAENNFKDTYFTLPTGEVEFIPLPED